MTNVFPYNQGEANAYNNGVFDDSNPYEDIEHMMFYDDPEDYDHNLFDEDMAIGYSRHIDDSLYYPVYYTKEDALEDKWNTWREYYDEFPEREDELW